MSGAPPNCSWRLATAQGAGAIAVFELIGDVDAGLARLGASDPGVGGMRTADLCGVDVGVAARPSERAALLMPHGGPAITRALGAALSERGLAEAGPDHSPLDRFPEARDGFEALTLCALARAASGLAVDLLLDQPARWRAWDGAAPDRAEIERRSAVLDRLIDPPRVVAVGRANVGKSAMVNALARRRVSIVADEPGTTRDHVGVTLDLGGLTVHWIDAPGWRRDGGSIEREAMHLARAEIARADLVLICGDGDAPAPSAEDLGVGPGQAALRVATRTDLRPGPREYDVATAAAPADGGPPRGLEDLVRAVRETLCHEKDRAWAGPWAFDRRLFEIWPEIRADSASGGGGVEGSGETL